MLYYLESNRRVIVDIYMLNYDIRFFLVLFIEFCR